MGNEVDVVVLVLVVVAIVWREVSDDNGNETDAE
jgi:hypothetical protein